MSTDTQGIVEPGTEIVNETVSETTGAENTNPAATVEDTNSNVDFDPFAGVETPEEIIPQGDPSEVIRNEIRGAIEETLKTMALQNQQAKTPEDPVKALEAKLANLENQLTEVTNRSAMAKEIQASQQVLNSYVNNISNGLAQVGVTPDTDPFFYKALNAELTAAIVLAEGNLKRPLNRQETHRLLQNFQKEWSPHLTAKGLGKAPAVNTTVTPGNPQFGNSNAAKPSASNDNILKRIEETNDVMELIKMGIRPTPKN